MVNKSYIMHKYKEKQKILIYTEHLTTCKILLYRIITPCNILETRSILFLKVRHAKLRKMKEFTQSHTLGGGKAGPQSVVGGNHSINHPLHSKHHSRMVHNHY